MTLCVYILKQLVLASGSCGSTFTSHFLEMVNSCVAAGCKNLVRRTGQIGSQLNIPACVAVILKSVALQKVLDLERHGLH